MNIVATNHDHYYYEIAKKLRNAPTVITRGNKVKELTNVSAKVIDPRDRILTEKNRKWPHRGFTAEFLWYMSEDRNIKTIKRYLPAWELYADERGNVNSNYGSYIVPQINNIVNILKKDPGARHACASIYNSVYSRIVTKDVPCTFSVQFLIRNNKLDIIVFNRSRDAVKGECGGDFYNFSLFQEIVANQLEIDVGEYHSHMGSLHVYENDWEKLFLDMYNFDNDIKKKYTRETNLTARGFFSKLKRKVRKNERDYLADVCREKDLDIKAFHRDLINTHMYRGTKIVYRDIVN